MITALKRRAWRIWARVATRPAADVLDEIAALPVVQADALLAAGPILVMAPHPDDESLGCGGLLALAAQQGVPARIVFMTDGSGSHPGSVDYPPERLRDLREAEAIEAAAVLGLERNALVFLRQPDGTLPRTGHEAAGIVARVAEEARRIGAATLFSTWIFDGHTDHVTTALLAKRVAKAIGATLYYYPIWGLRLEPNSRLPKSARPAGWRLDISGVVDLKKQAIARHRSQMTGLIQDSATTAPETEVFAIFDQPYERYVKA
jgi:LmbE family N-acetylglucosaminyl deacetylase